MSALGYDTHVAIRVVDGSANELGLLMRGLDVLHLERFFFPGS
jgi:hypothetical protein